MHADNIADIRPRELRVSTPHNIETPSTLRTAPVWYVYSSDIMLVYTSVCTIQEWRNKRSKIVFIYILGLLFFRIKWWIQQLQTWYRQKDKQTIALTMFVWIKSENRKHEWKACREPFGDEWPWCVCACHCQCITYYVLSLSWICRIICKHSLSLRALFLRASCTAFPLATQTSEHKRIDTIA